MDLLLIIDVFFDKDWKPERLPVFFSKKRMKADLRDLFLFS